LVGIKPEYQGKGVNALLFQDLIPQYIKRGFKWAESNPELATNDKVQGQWQYFKNRNHRKRVALKKTI
jgi:GNAT superfamily N-acetyltransferase